MSEKLAAFLVQKLTRCRPAVTLRYDKCVDMNRPFVLYGCVVEEALDDNELTVTLRYSKMAQLPGGME